MKKSTAEFFAKYGATRVLVENLENVLEVFGEQLSDDNKQGLMRANLITTRQCLEDFGAE